MDPALPALYTPHSPPTPPPLLSAFHSDADVHLVGGQVASEAAKRLSGASFSAVETDLTGSTLGVAQDIDSLLDNNVGHGRFGAVRSRWEISGLAGGTSIVNCPFDMYAPLTAQWPLASKFVGRSFRKTIKRKFAFQLFAGYFSKKSFQFCF
jgi:hypothetical protein